MVDKENKKVQKKEVWAWLKKVKYYIELVKDKFIKVAKGYINTSKKSVRYEILNLVLIATFVAVVSGTLVSWLAVGLGIGRYHVTDYMYNHDATQSTIQSVSEKLSSLDDIQVTYNIEPQKLKSFLEDYIEEDLELVYLEEYLQDYIAIEHPWMDVYLDYHLLDLNFEALADLYVELNSRLEEASWNDTEVRIIVQDFYNKYMDRATLRQHTMQYMVQDIIYGMDTIDNHMADYSYYFLDDRGEILYNQAITARINIIEVLKKSNMANSIKEICELIPIPIDGEIYYLYVEGNVQGEQNIYYSNLPQSIGWLVGIFIFIVSIVKLTAGKIRYIEYLSECLGEIAKGNLDYDIDVKGEDELARVAINMRWMERQLKKQIDERRVSEQTKNELITNVAHDLRTPLTSIIGYIDLVKEKRYTTEEEKIHYLDIAYSKSQKLKILIQDLFEYTKLTSHPKDLKKETIPVALLMNQLIEEISPQAEEKNIRILSHVKIDNSSVSIDVMKMARVFENLLENAIKYSETDEVIQVIIQKQKGSIYTTVRNRYPHMKDGTMEDEDMSKLFERFYRTDTSRNSTTGGSGLGLAISKSIVEMHGGKIWAQVDGNIISFTVKLKYHK